MSTPAAKESPIRAHGPVRVSLPASVAYKPDALKKTIGGLMERLGCPRCFSGADCMFSLERDFVVDPAGAIRNPGTTVELNPQPLPPRASSAVVSLGRQARYDINQVFKAIDNVIDLLGPCPCHSGYDVLYQNELPVIGVNEHGAQRYGG